ncbi:MAG: ABC-F family ATP-binding cassette domain-containing protein [Bacillota bacterium]
MIAISCSNISKSYGINTILQDISFNINEKERVGLIGDNGAGKTTLFKILTGEIHPDNGQVFLSKDKTLGYLKQKTSYKEDTTIYEACLPTFQDLIDKEKNLRKLEEKISNDPTNQKLLDEYSDKLDIFEKSGGYSYKGKIKGVLNGLGFGEKFFDKSVDILSGGQKSKLQLGLLLLEEPDILLLDEPTNHLDLEATAWLENFLNDFPNTVITITHDRYFLDKVTTKIIEIENRSILEYNGSYSEFKEYKKELIKTKKRTYQKQQKKIEKQKEIIRRFKGRGTEKLAKRAKSREKMLDKMEKIDKPTKNQREIKLKFEPKIKSGEDILKVKKLSKSFDELLFKNLNFDIFKGEKIGLIGPNGVGKSTLFKIILDKIDYDNGKVLLGHNVFPGYFDQEQKNLDLENTLFDEILEVVPKEKETNIRTYLGMFEFKGDDVFKEIKTLSGGEKARLSLLKLMLTNANFLLLDEPTNHLDIKSKEILEKALNNYNGTLFIISHDRYFLNNVTNKTFEFSKDNIQTYLGNFDYYIKKKQINKELTKKDEVNTKTKTQLKKERKKRKEKKKEIRQKKKRSKEIMKKIEKLEQKLDNNDILLCKEEIYSDGQKVKEINDENEKIEKQINSLYEEWSEIDKFLENL